MSYCIVNYRDESIRSLQELGTISPITPDIEGLLLEEIPAGYRIIGGTTRNTDVGILACKVEKIPQQMPGTTSSTPDVPIEPITSVYTPKNIKILDGSAIIYKNIIKLFEKKLVPLFENKELLLYNSKNGACSTVVPTKNQILINFNSIPNGITPSVGSFRFDSNHKIVCNGGYKCDQIFPHCVFDNTGEIPILQGDKSIIYVHWDGISIVSDAKILIDVFFTEFAQLLKTDMSTIDFSVKKLATTYRSTLSRRIEEYKNNLLYKTQDFKNLKKKMIEMSDYIRDEEYKINGIEEFSKNLEDDIRTRIQAALNFKEIEKIEPSGSIIKIYTKNIFFTKSKTEIYFIGKFEIIINIKEFSVIFNNTAIRVYGYHNGMNAPHVFSDGHACLGSMASDLPESIKNGSIDMVCLLCINFLKSVNPSDAAGKFYSRWPMVKDGVLSYSDAKYVKVLDKTYEEGKEIVVI